MRESWCFVKARVLEGACRCQSHPRGRNLASPIQRPVNPAVALPQHHALCCDTEARKVHRSCVVSLEPLDNDAHVSGGSPPATISSSRQAAPNSRPSDNIHLHGVHRQPCRNFRRSNYHFQRQLGTKPLVSTSVVGRHDACRCGVFRPSKFVQPTNDRIDHAVFTVLTGRE